MKKILYHWTRPFNVNKIIKEHEALIPTSNDLSLFGIAEPVLFLTDIFNPRMIGPGSWEDWRYDKRRAVFKIDIDRDIYADFIPWNEFIKSEVKFSKNPKLVKQMNDLLITTSSKEIMDHCWVTFNETSFLEDIDYMFACFTYDDFPVWNNEVFDKWIDQNGIKTFEDASQWLVEKELSKAKRIKATEDLIESINGKETIH